MGLSQQKMCERSLRPHAYIHASIEQVITSEMHQRNWKKEDDTLNILQIVTLLSPTVKATHANEDS